MKLRKETHCPICLCRVQWWDAEKLDFHLIRALHTEAFGWTCPGCAGIVRKWDHQARLLRYLKGYEPEKKIINNAMPGGIGI